MKKFLRLTLVLSLMATSLSFAQKGFKGGINLATWGGSDSKGPSGETPGTLTAFNAGVFATINIPLLPISIQPEALYSMKGAKYAGSNFTVTHKFAYVEIPVLVKLNIPLVPGAPVKPNIFVGPAVSFKLSAKKTTEVTGLPSNEKDETDVKSTDFGAVFGVGVDIHLPVITLTVDARYNLGLTTIDASSANADIKNRVISVDAGIGF